MTTTKRQTSTRTERKVASLFTSCGVRSCLRERRVGSLWSLPVWTIWPLALFLTRCRRIPGTSSKRWPGGERRTEELMRQRTCFINLLGSSDFLYFRGYFFFFFSFFAMSEQRLQFLLLAGGGKGCWERHRMTQNRLFTVSRQVFWKVWQLQRSTDRCTLNDKCEEGWGEDYGAPPQPLTFTGPWYRTNGEAFTGLHQSLKKTQLIHSNKSKLLTFPWYHAPLSLSLYFHRSYWSLSPERWRSRT